MSLHSLLKLIYPDASWALHFHSDADGYTIVCNNRFLLTVDTAYIAEDVLWDVALAYNYRYSAPPIWS